jgi:hypothetical protein
MKAPPCILSAVLVCACAPLGHRATTATTATTNGAPEILRHPAKEPTTQTRRAGEAVCWDEPAWMFPGPTDCHGYWGDAPGVPRCLTTKRADEPRPSRTEWGTRYQLDEALTREARKRDAGACCYRCVDALIDMGQ